MSDKKQKEQQTVVINDVEYKPEDLNEEQVMLVNHVDQLQGGREFFMKKLEKTLDDKDKETEMDK